MNEYAVGRASADLRDAILKSMGLPTPIRLPGPRRERKPPAPAPVRLTYRVERCPKVETIKATVAEYYGVDINKRGRGVAEVANARQIAMYLSREVAKQSYPRIGWMFDRDHTTVMHGVREVEKKMAADHEVQADIQALREMLAA